MKTKNKNGKLGVKLLVPLAAVIVFLIASVVSTYMQVNTVRKSVRTLQTDKVAVMETAQDIRFHVLHTSEIFTDMSAVKDEEGMEEAAEIKADIHECFEKMKSLRPSEASYWADIAAEYDVFYATCERMKEAYIGSGQEAGNAVMEEVDPITEKLSEEVDAYATKQIEEMDDYIVEIEEQADTIILIFIITSAIVMALIIFTTVVVTEQVIKPVKKVTKAIDALAGRDLAIENVSVKNNDEIGKLADSNNSLLESMRSIVTDLNESSQKMDSVSGTMANNANTVTESMADIAEAVGAIATNASDQASDVERTLDEMNNLQTIIATNETTSNNLALASEEIAKASNEGAAVIEELYRVTKESEETFEAIFESIRMIIDSTNQIRQASGMIEGIASQTNLLSLNASIEAARAGDMGRGFAVVAEEIRTLSDGSRENVDEINRMLVELQANVDKASEQSDIIRMAIEKQVAGVEQTRAKYENIAQNVEGINNEIDSLGEVSKALTNSCAVVNQIMDNLAAGSQENAASTEETNASVEEILAMMHEIEEGSKNIRDISALLQDQVHQYNL